MARNITIALVSGVPCFTQLPGMVPSGDTRPTIQFIAIFQVPAFSARGSSASCLGP
jgi:hypothetical protein